MEDNQYLYETTPERVKAVQWNGENDEEVDIFVSGYGKHDLFRYQESLIIKFNCYSWYTMTKDCYLVDKGGGEFKVMDKYSFEYKYRKVE